VEPPPEQGHPHERDAGESALAGDQGKEQRHRDEARHQQTGDQARLGPVEPQREPAPRDERHSD